MAGTQCRAQHPQRVEGHSRTPGDAESALHEQRLRRAGFQTMTDPRQVPVLGEHEAALAILSVVEAELQDIPGAVSDAFWDFVFRVVDGDGEVQFGQIVQLLPSPEVESHRAHSTSPKRAIRMCHAWEPFRATAR